MTAWPQVKLGSYFRIKHGFAFKSEFFAKQGEFIVLTPGNFREDGGLKSQGEKEKFYSAVPPAGFILNKGDLLVVMTDLTQEARILGAPAFVPQSDLYLHNQRLGKVVDLDEAVLDKRYLYYAMNWSAVRDQIKATATGATVRHTAPDRMYAVEVPLPTLATQRKIASILSAYDDLIENNTLRIEILEEMARRLYEEWFIHHCFPGHEETSLPFEEVNIFDVFIVRYGKGLPKKNLIEGAEFPVYGAAKVIGRYDVYNYEARQIIAGCRGSVGEFRITKPKSFVTNNSFIFSPITSDDFFWGYQALKARGLKDVVGGAAQPQITLDGLRSVNLFYPPHELRKRYSDLVSPMFSMIWALERKNTNLRAQRDLLLPKLVSGEINVSDIPMHYDKEIEAA